MRNPFLLRGLLVAGCVALLDQLSKKFLLGIMQGHEHFVEVTSFFNLVMVWNRGVSFGLLQSNDARHALIAFTLLVLCALFVWLARARSTALTTALGMIIGGATGNLFDRFIYRAVADFFDFHVLGHHWPAFNIADAAISCGVALLLWHGWREDRAPRSL